MAALALVLACSSVLEAQQPADVRAYLVVIDDLHIDFRSTPRLRDLLERVIPPVLRREGSVVGIVSTGYSSLSEAPSASMARVTSAIERVTGGSLRPQEVMAVLEPGSDDREIRSRSRVALTTLVEAIRGVRRRVPSSRLVIIHISSGHLMPADADDFQAVVRTAQDAQSTIHVISVSDLVTAPVPQPDSEIWRRYVHDARDTLRQLAAATGGLMVTNATDLEHLVNVMSN